MATKETSQPSSGAGGADPLHAPAFLWMELTRHPSSLFHDLCDFYPGHRISDQEQLRAAIETLSPSFICLESDQPGVDGIHLLAETGARHPHLPLVVLSDDPSKDTMVLAYRSGVASYLVKPITLYELVREIRILLALSRDHAPLPDGPPAMRSSLPIEATVDPGSRRPVSRIAAALARLEQGYAGDLRLDHLATACHMSGSHFSHTFKKEHGLSFRRYLLCYRLERACELLVLAGMSIKQAALAAGFNDCSYFDRAFRQRYGMTPRDYQARHAAPRPEKARGTARA